MIGDLINREDSCKVGRPGEMSRNQESPTQIGRAGTFAKGKPARGSQLHLLSKHDFAVLPTNDLGTKCHFSVLGRKAPVAKFGNKKVYCKGFPKWLDLISVQNISKCSK